MSQPAADITDCLSICLFSFIEDNEKGLIYMELPQRLVHLNCVQSNYCYEEIVSPEKYARYNSDCSFLCLPWLFMLAILNHYFTKHGLRRNVRFWVPLQRIPFVEAAYISFTKWRDESLFIFDQDLGRNSMLILDKDWVLELLLQLPINMKYYCLLRFDYRKKKLPINLKHKAVCRFENFCFF